MTELSPQAQAVWDAYELVGCDPYEIDPRKAGLSAALRAAANQVVPPAVLLEYYERNESPVLGKAIEVRNKLLAIAADLRGDNTTPKEAP